MTGNGVPDAMIQIEIDTANAAFQPDPAIEVARILRDVVERLEQGTLTGKFSRLLKDVNGNYVGGVFGHFHDPECLLDEHDGECLTP
jgi:hypothetical protein